VSNDATVRRVDIVVKADKKIDIKTDGKPVEVNLGHVKIEEGALKHRKLESNIIIDAEKGIVVH
jgi:ATP-dependent protease HslVU (ClpYQ) peptidase subunit